MVEEMMVSRTWDCLSVPVHKNGLYTNQFTSKDSVVDAFSTASVSFCPGLIDVVQSPVPPKSDWFKQLGTDAARF